MPQPDDSPLKNSKITKDFASAPNDQPVDPDSPDNLMPDQTPEQPVEEQVEQTTAVEELSQRITALETQRRSGMKFALYSGLAIGLMGGIGATLLGIKYTQTPPPQKQEFDYTAYDAEIQKKLNAINRRQTETDTAIADRAKDHTTLANQVDQKFALLPSHYAQLENRINGLNTILGGQTTVLGGQANQIGAQANTLSEYNRRIRNLEDMPLQDPRLADTAFVTSLASLLTRTKPTESPTPQPEDDPSLPPTPRPTPRTDAPTPSANTRQDTPQTKFLPTYLREAYLRELTQIRTENQGNPSRRLERLTDLDRRYGIQR